MAYSQMNPFLRSGPNTWLNFLNIWVILRIVRLLCASVCEVPDIFFFFWLEFYLLVEKWFCFTNDLFLKHIWAHKINVILHTPNPKTYQQLDSFLSFSCSLFLRSLLGWYLHAFAVSESHLFVYIRHTKMISVAKLSRCLYVFYFVSVSTQYFSSIKNIICFFVGRSLVVFQSFPWKVNQEHFLPPLIPKNKTENT